MVTLGADGALLVERADGPVQRLPAFRVATVDTTGAGDAFNGVLAAGLASGMDLRRRDAPRYGRRGTLHHPAGRPGRAAVARSHRGHVGLSDLGASQCRMATTRVSWSG